MAKGDNDITRKKQKVKKVKQLKAAPKRGTSKKYKSNVKVKAPKKKGLTKTQKERKLVQQQIRRLEKKGYRVPDEFKAKVSTAKYQTLHSIRANRYEKLYKASTYLTTGGEIKQGRAKKGEIAPPITVKPQPVSTYENEPTFEEEEAARLAEFELRKDDAEYQAELDIGNAYMNWIETEIKQFEKTGSGEFGKYFREVVDDILDEYTMEDLMQAIANAPADFLAEAEAVLYYSGDQSNLRPAMGYLYQVIKGHMPDRKTAAHMDRMYEQEEDAEFFAT